MKGPEVNFASVKQGVTLEAVLRLYRLNDLTGGRNGRYRGRCPIHQGDGRDAFHVDVRRKIFHCFSCGAGGDVLDWVGTAEPVHAAGRGLATARLAPGCSDADRPARETTG